MSFLNEIRLRCLLKILLVVLLLAPGAHAAPISLHPDNGRYFLFRDKPVVLMGSSEHYGAVINLDFDYIRYLDEVRACGLNLVRIFPGTYRETNGSFNIPDNTLNPPPGKGITPWKRTAEPGAGDGGNKFDLSQWDPTFFFRLRDFVAQAGQRGIVVELTFFSIIYDDTLWALSPMNGANNVNSVGHGGRLACYSVNSDLLPAQKALVRKCVNELKDFDNVIYEPCNEPYQGNVPAAWEDIMIGELVDAEAGFTHKHMIARNVFNDEGIITNPHPAVSIFNFHYALPQAASANLGLNKALGDDETGFAGREDFPYRKEAWQFIFSGGALFNHLDYSFTDTREDGIATQQAPGGGGPAIRRQIGVLRWFMEELPLTSLTPLPGLVTGGVPAGGSAHAIGVTGGGPVAVYLQGGTQATLSLNLPAGSYGGRWIDPRSGLASADVAEFAHNGGARAFTSPVYHQDVVLHLAPQPRVNVALASPSHGAVFSSNTETITLTAEVAVAGGSITGVEFLEGETSLGVDNSAPYSLELANPGKGQHVFRARAVLADGNKALSPPVKVTVAGRFQSGVNLNGGQLVMNGQLLQSESQAAAAGLVTTNARPSSASSSLLLYPAPDAATEDMLLDQVTRNSSQSNQALGINHPVPNDTYDVYLFVVEGEQDYSRDMSVSLEGQIVASGIGDMAKGEWNKYGPYRVQVTDGVLNVDLRQLSKGNPKIAGFSVYQAEPSPVLAGVQLLIEHSGDAIVLSYPSGLSSATVEYTDNLADAQSWQDLPEQGFTLDAWNLITLPADPPSRFFRLRMD